MTPRERVLAAVNHKAPDRVPMNYLGTPEIDERLRRRLNLPDPGPFAPGYMVDYDWDIVERLGVDIRTLRLRYTGPALPTFDDGRLQNYWGVIYKPVSNQVGTYMESSYLPYANFETLDDLAKYPWPNPDWFAYQELPEQCRQLGDCAIVYGWPGNMDLINGTAFGRGFEQTIFDLATENPAGLGVIEKRFEFHLEQTRRALEACRGRIDIVWIGDDYGTQRGLLLRPATWRKLFKGKLRAWADLAHKHGAKLMLHSCGSTRPIWPDFVDVGLDIYDTIQPEAVGMAPNELAAEFGKDICLHGTVSTQRLMPFATPEEVAQLIRHRIETIGAAGGLILAPSHNFQPDTPIDNILAMYRAAGSMQ